MDTASASGLLLPYHPPLGLTTQPTYSFILTRNSGGVGDFSLFFLLLCRLVTAAVEEGECRGAAGDWRPVVSQPRPREELERSCGDTGTVSSSEGQQVGGREVSPPSPALLHCSHCTSLYHTKLELETDSQSQSGAVLRNSRRTDRGQDRRGAGRDQGIQCGAGGAIGSGEIN